MFENVPNTRNTVRRLRHGFAKRVYSSNPPTYSATSLIPDFSLIQPLASEFSIRYLSILMLLKTFILPADLALWFRKPKSNYESESFRYVS